MSTTEATPTGLTTQQRIEEALNLANIRRCDTVTHGCNRHCGASGENSGVYFWRQFAWMLAPYLDRVEAGERSGYLDANN